ncbi:hypothetical protein PWT90_05092 [Aphanocladium album]|nr:hypothetical protein PWT90_05092 [Aphanocladium album]
MSQSLRPYLQCVRSSLTAALTLSNFASQTAERHNVPEIEAHTSPEVLLTPLTIARNENERVLIEPSINSIRISIKIKQADEIEHILVHKFTRFLTQRAESFFILRRKPIKGYDISFLITNFHTDEMLKHKLVDFIIQFMEDVDKEISEMKLFLNARARFVAESFLTPSLRFVLALLNMAMQSQSLLRLFTSGSESSQISLDTSLPSPPDSDSSYASSIMLSRANSGCSIVALQSKLNPESAVWTPSSWGDLSSTAVEHPNLATKESAVSSATTRLISHEDFAHDDEPRNGEQALSSYAFLTSPMPPRHQHMRGKSNVSSSLPTSGRMTEPRNYAPRTAGLPMSSEPPPKFNLELPTVSQNDHETLPSPEKFDQQLGALVQQTLPTPRSLTVYQPPAEDYDGRSEKLKVITHPAWGSSKLATVLDPSNMPFVEAAKQAKAKNHGVVRLGNIPFATKRSEVIAFLGRNSKILNDAEEPVHIIMEKVTSKTMDAYVEFLTLEDAMRAVDKHTQNQLSGRPTRLGDRPVDLQLSSQASLMRDLFPVAAGVVWKGVTPEIQQCKPREPWANFKGFISAEEMVMLVKHVEVPHRSPFSKECPQRPYECLISTLRKFPWYMTDCITVNQRNAMFQATRDLLRLLQKSLDKGDDPVSLNRQLLRRVAKAAMECPGFTTLMKDDIAWIMGMSDGEQHSYGQPRFASSWRHQYALVPKPGMPLDVVEWYIAAIREQTMRDVFARPHNERRGIQEKAQDTDGYWGYFWVEVDYPTGGLFDNMTLAQAAQSEFTAIENILTRAHGSA